MIAVVAVVMMMREAAADICVNKTGWWRGGSAFNTSGTRIPVRMFGA